MKTGPSISTCKQRIKSSTASLSETSTKRNQAWPEEFNFMLTPPQARMCSLVAVYLHTASNSYGRRILSHRWTTLAVDFATVLHPVTKQSFEALRSAQFCASMRVRNLFTSENKYSATSMPKVRAPALSIASSKNAWPVEAFGQGGRE